MRVDAYHCSNTSNIGDLSALPSAYFLGDEAVDVHDVDARFLQPGSPLVAVIGGGGLIQHYLAQGVRNAMAQHRVNILWGIGLNGEDVQGDSYRDKDWLKAADLVGVRDWGSDVRYRWVPCPSCMHPVFDAACMIEPEHDFVIYEHIHHPVGIADGSNEYRILKAYTECDLANIPRMNNTVRTIEDAVKFLASGRCVLTSSYHGAYWATLLGCEVIVVKPWSSKFERMRFPPVIVGESLLWDSHEKYPEALEECRQATLAFADDVRILLRSIS